MLRCFTKKGCWALGFLITSGCQSARKDRRVALPALFPDAARTLGPFAIHLEKSRDSSLLSAARVKIDQGPIFRHVTLQIKMLHSQEQVTLSFLPEGPSTHQGQDQNSLLRCLPLPASMMDTAALPSEARAPALQKTADSFHIPLPLSIHEASSLQVTGVGESWQIINNRLQWNPQTTKSTRIGLSWTRSQSPELRYPLQTRIPPKNLKARRIEEENEEEIQVDWADGFVTLDEADVKTGAWLELQYDIAANETSFQLPQIPAFGNMNILSLQDDCPRDAYLLERDDLSWDCPQNKGPLWAASYSFRQVNAAWDLHDWPELAKQAPRSLQTFADSGETLEVAWEESGRMLPKVPPEASRICLRATWSSDLPR